MLCCILKHQHQILPFSSLAILSLPQTQNLPYRPMSPIHLLLCLPMIPRSRLLLHYSEAWDTKLSSLTLSLGRKPAAPPSSSCHIPGVVSAESKEGPWLVISAPFSPSALSGQQIVQGKRRPNFMPKSQTLAQMCFIPGEQVSGSNTGLEKGLLDSIFQMQMQAVPLVVCCTAKHKLLLCITMNSSLGLRTQLCSYPTGL